MPNKRSGRGFINCRAGRAQGGGEDYARQLLANCLQLDPGNITYRQTRDMTQKASTGMLSRFVRLSLNAALK